MGWWTDLFKKNDSYPTIQPDKPWPRSGSTAEKDISEPALSFVECVRNNPKRFIAEYSESSYIYTSGMSAEDCMGYKIYDKVAKKGWYLLGKYFYNHWFVHGYPREGGPFYNDPFFLTEDEKSYILKEVKLIMEYRGERKKKLEQIRKERRIRDERNRLKAIYK